MTSFIGGLTMTMRWNKLWAESTFFVSSFISFLFCETKCLIYYFISALLDKKIIHNTICRWYLFATSEANNNSLQQPIRLIRDEQRSLSVGYV
jgi:predicted transglutaminase-like protease